MPCRIRKRLGIFPFFRTTSWSALSSKAAYQAEWAKKLQAETTMNRSVSYLQLSTRALHGDSTKDIKTERQSQIHPHVHPQSQTVLPASPAAIPPTADTTDDAAAPLTADNLQKLEEQHKTLGKSDPMPNDPTNLVKPNKSIVTQVWVRIKVDGIQITVPSERSSHRSHGVTVE